jgi:hypothetical protein
MLCLEIGMTPIAGFPNYRVDRDGNIFSCFVPGGQGATTNTWRKLAAKACGKGHLQVKLYRGGSGNHVQKLVHRLVLEAFVGPCPPGMEGCHNDGNPANNCLSNLRWDTPVGNWEDRKRHGRGTHGARNPFPAKLTETAVVDIRESRRRGVPLRVLADKHGVSVSNVCNVATYRAWRHVNG